MVDQYEERRHLCDQIHPFTGKVLDKLERSVLFGNHAPQGGRGVRHTILRSNPRKFSPHFANCNMLSLAGVIVHIECIDSTEKHRKRGK